MDTKQILEYELKKIEKKIINIQINMAMICGFGNCWSNIPLFKIYEELQMKRRKILKQLSDLKKLEGEITKSIISSIRSCGENCDDEKFAN